MAALDKANSGASGPLTTLDGAVVRRMFALAAAWLERHASAIDAINVFPVPDGDTGANLSHTMQATLRALASEADQSGAAAWNVAARGALLGARGNSGVILSQWLRGLAEQLSDQAGVSELVTALSQAHESARGAVGEPREGTILSVAAALAGPQESAAAGDDIIAFFETMSIRARKAVDFTPQQMQILADAGVVDAGALGLATIIEGFSFALSGTPLPETAADVGEIDADWLVSTQEPSSGMGFDFCTEFVVQGARLDPTVLRATLMDLGESVVVVGDDSLLHAHLHTSTPELAFEAASDFGTLSEQKADDMSAQHATLVGKAHGEFPSLAIVAVASGAGFTNLFHELGVTAVVPGGPTMNPSAEAIMRAAATTHARAVLVLPNDGNIIAAATQAARLAHDEPATPQLFVVPTSSQAAGIAALTAFDRNADVEVNATEMSASASAILAGAVTFAARAVQTPVPLVEGQPFALLDSEIIAGAATIHEALRLLVDQMRAVDPDASLLTLYQGIDLDADAARHACDDISQHVSPTLEVELVIGGQPHYPWVVALE